MNQREFSLENLKNVELKGYLIFTNAVETGEDKGGSIVLTSDTKPGVDIALMNTGFYFDRDSGSNVYWMKRAETEHLRYYPFKATDVTRESPVIKMAAAQGMKTRIDFFCHSKGNAAYDVVSELLKLGYKALTFPPQNFVIQNLFLIEPDGENYKISSIK